MPLRVEHHAALEIAEAGLVERQPRLFHGHRRRRAHQRELQPKPSSQFPSTLRRHASCSAGYDPCAARLQRVHCRRRGRPRLAGHDRHASPIDETDLHRPVSVLYLAHDAGRQFGIRQCRRRIHHADMQAGKLAGNPLEEPSQCAALH